MRTSGGFEMATPMLGRSTYGRGLQSQAERQMGGLGQARGGQEEAMDAYRTALAGEGPSVAERQMQQGIQQATRQQLQAQAAGRGGNLAAMSARAAGAGAAAQQQAVQQGSMLRAQEQQAALAGMGGLATQMAGQDIQQRLALQQMALGAQTSEMQAQMQHELESRRLAEMEKQGQFNRIMGGIQTGASALGGMFSDINLKEDIRPGSSAVSEALGGPGGDRAALEAQMARSDAAIARSLAPEDPRAYTGPQEAARAFRSADPFVYQYNDRGRELGQPEGDRLGVMAQDLEKTPAGSQIVRDGPHGKEIDMPGAVSLGLAANADHERRLSQLEGGAPDIYSTVESLPEAQRYEADQREMAYRARVSEGLPEGYVHPLARMSPEERDGLARMGYGLDAREAADAGRPLYSAEDEARRMELASMLGGGGPLARGR